MLILGLNAYHGDSSACLVRDGQLIAAIEEERINRIKHWAGFPIESIKWCLKYVNARIEDVQYIALSRDPSAHLKQKIMRILFRTPSFKNLKQRLQNVARIQGTRAALCAGFGVPECDLPGKIVNVEHHRAHLSSAYLVSSMDEAVCVSIDGFGDYVSTMRGIGRGNKIAITDWVEYPHSLGIFYAAFTQYLGFWHYGDEYKVMGLSAAGEPKFLDKMREIVQVQQDGRFKLNTSFFLHDKEGVDMVWENQSPVVGRLFSEECERIFGPARQKDEAVAEHHRNIAASVQAMYEEAFFHLLNAFYEKTHIRNLALSGGCIQNSLANGKIYAKTPYERVYIAPASYDAGTAVGAAYSVWCEILGNERTFTMASPYWGPAYGDAEIEGALAASGVNFEKLGDEALARRIAKDISDGAIVGWFQGRTEWGPRALGNRSIVVDPRRPEMKDILNERIKRREGFRPFAPSVLIDHVSEWFECDQPVPFMEKVYKIRTGKRAAIPSVTHVDGTGRLQTVSPEMNSKYYSLIREYHAMTGVPMILNTSFNENEPIVNTPQDAVGCFLRTKMDVLAIGNYYCSAIAS